MRPASGALPHLCPKNWTSAEFNRSAKGLASHGTLFLLDPKKVTFNRGISSEGFSKSGAGGLEFAISRFAGDAGVETLFRGFTALKRVLRRKSANTCKCCAFRFYSLPLASALKRELAM